MHTLARSPRPPSRALRFVAKYCPRRRPRGHSDAAVPDPSRLKMMVETPSDYFETASIARSAPRPLVLAASNPHSIELRNLGVTEMKPLHEPHYHDRL